MPTVLGKGNEMIHYENPLVCCLLANYIVFFFCFGERSTTLSDETKKFHRDRYRDFFSRPNISRPRLFFETKYFRDRYRDFFSRPNVFETDTEPFF